MADTRLFMVRVWQQSDEFRASVRGVDETEPLLFTEPAKVAEFLRNACASPGSGDAGGEAR